MRPKVLENGGVKMKKKLSPLAAKQKKNALFPMFLVKKSA